MSRRITEAQFHGMSEKELAELIEDVFPGEEVMSGPLSTNYIGELPYQQAPRDVVIGYLADRDTFPGNGTGLGFLCLDCADPDYDRSPVYGVNLNPYRAVCLSCKRVIVMGCGVELFSGR